MMVCCPFLKFIMYYVWVGFNNKDPKYIQGKGNVILTTLSDNFPSTPFTFFSPSYSLPLQLRQKASFTPTILQ